MRAPAKYVDKNSSLKRPLNNFTLESFQPDPGEMFAVAEPLSMHHVLKLEPDAIPRLIEQKDDCPDLARA